MQPKSCRRGRATAHIARTDLYCGLVIVGFANGISERIGNEIHRHGLMTAVFNTFGVSVVVWAAAVLALSLLLRAERQPATRMDFAVAVIASIAFLMPVPSVSWLALAGIAAYLAVTSDPPEPMRRAAVVIGAMTVPMLWARILFAAMSNTILEADAKLVSWIVGTRSTGNTVPFADGTGILFLEPGCSSLTNLSLAVLCGVLFVKGYNRRWSAAIVRTIVLACAATITINVVRIGTIGIFPDYYDVIHGQVGATLVDWIIIMAMIVIFTEGIKPDAQARA